MRTGKDHMAELMTFGAHLRAKRLARNLTQRFIGEMLGVSAPYISDIEKGRRAPFPARESYAKIAKVLGGSESDWLARGVAERVRIDVEGMPKHIGEFVCDVVVCAHGISSSDIKKMRDYITALRR